MSQKTRLSVYRLIYVPTFIRGLRVASLLLHTEGSLLMFRLLVRMPPQGRVLGMSNHEEARERLYYMDGLGMPWWSPSRATGAGWGEQDLPALSAALDMQ